MKKLISLILIISILLCGCVEVVVQMPTQPQPSLDPDSTGSDMLTVHYIDVGQADCALIETDGKFVLIDGGNREDGQMVVSYLQQQGVEELEAVICSHAHEDHVGGLPSVLAVFPTKAVYAPTRTYSSDIFDDFLHYTDQQGLEMTIPAPGDEFIVGQTRFTILGPTRSYAETNDTSIIVLAEHTETRFLFTGDMETAAENDMLDYWDGRFDWNVDVLKVGHHGSDTSSGYRFVYETDPEYAIISVGEDNSYGHPHESVTSRYADAGIPMFRTDILGTVCATTDGYNVTITWENQNASPEDVESGEKVVYVGNKNSMKLHSPDCKNLPSEKNRVEFSSYNEAIAAGYEPCGSCLG
ncbi:MAG: MBL fold metallo-hydrolase [Oscillospiraceae bacterium]|nr:MBL fold metallo-hydrolase [Oscillospiraceae bacterium]